MSKIGGKGKERERGRKNSVGLQVFNRALSTLTYQTEECLTRLDIIKPVQRLN